MNTQEINACMEKSILLKMAFERHQSYLSSLRALEHLFFNKDENTEPGNNQEIATQYMAHIVRLMEDELTAISELHSHQMALLSEQANQRENICEERA